MLVEINVRVGIDNGQHNNPCKSLKGKSYNRVSITLQSINVSNIE